MWTKNNSLSTFYPHLWIAEIGSYSSLIHKFTGPTTTTVNNIYIIIYILREKNMKFSIEQKQFQNALSIALKGISSKNIMEILKGIYIEAEDGHITLVSNNLEIGIKTRVEADVTENGTAIIEGKILSDIIRKLPDEKITISVNDSNIVKISAKKTKFNIKSMINTNFPQVEEFEDERYEKMDSLSGRCAALYAACDGRRGHVADAPAGGDLSADEGPGTENQG